MEKLDDPPRRQRGGVLIHGHTHGDTGLDSIQAICIAEGDHLADRVQVADAAVGAEGPVGLVLDAGDGLIAVLIVVEGVGDWIMQPGLQAVIDFFAGAFFVSLKNGLAGDVG